MTLWALLRREAKAARMSWHMWRTVQNYAAFRWHQEWVRRNQPDNPMPLFETRPIPHKGRVR